jgi:hypothetical protein
MKKKIFVLGAIIIMSFNAISQECNCDKSFDWMVSTFKKNDAGFQYIIDKKGLDDYNKFTAIIKEKVKNVSSVNDCQKIMLDWLHYFRSGHIGIEIKDTTIVDNSKKLLDDEIRQQYKNEKTIDLTEKQLIKILEKKQNKNPIEGIWSSDDYTIGIIGNEKSDKKFTAFIIKADSVYWMPKQVKAELTLNDDNKTYSVDYYTWNHFKEAKQAKIINKSGSLLYFTQFAPWEGYWKRTYPKVSLTKNEEFYSISLMANIPFVKKLSDKTIYLRIPSLVSEEKIYIDSILKNTANLIIDIRNSGGGADDSYSNIIPYLYTNPIRYVGALVLASELNTKYQEDYAKQINEQFSELKANNYNEYVKNLKDTVDINILNRIAKKMRDNIGKFVLLFSKDGIDEKIKIDSLHKVLPVPKKVAIICNHNNGSADEQFLIEAKQSSKVKVFGKPTGGMLDISSMNSIDFPDGKFTLDYSMTKSLRIPDYCIDGVGIQPDYFIDDSVNEEDWIEYTQKILEQE